MRQGAPVSRASDVMRSNRIQSYAQVTFENCRVSKFEVPIKSSPGPVPEKRYY